MKPGGKGLARIARAARYSIKGLQFAWRNETAFRQELLLFAVMVPVAVWIGETAVQTALLAGSCFLVLTVELLNTAVEAVVDRIGEDYHRLAGTAKDLGSAAVFLSLMAMLFVWVMVLLERFG